MIRYEVIEYEVIDNFTYFDRLFLTGDRLYIQLHDDEYSSYQRVFSPDRTYLGKLDYGTFSNMKGYFIRRYTHDE